MLSPLFLLLLLHLLLANAHYTPSTCSEDFFIAITQLNLPQCDRIALQTELAWKFNNTTAQLDVAFAAKLDTPTAWIAWGLNPDGPQMVGTRALIGIKQPTGLHIHKYAVTAAAKIGCQLAPADADIGLDVRNFSFEPVKHMMGNYYMIRATVVLSKEYNCSRLNMVWQTGFQAAGGEIPMMHPLTLDHRDSTQTIDLETHQVLTGFKDRLRRRLRILHGILNIVGWGICLPVGAILARYSRFKPFGWGQWKNGHVGFQIAGYTLGTIGWTIGLCLGDLSKHYIFLTHRILGIIIFSFTTIQMMALKLKPDDNDEYRPFWNMYHHSLGYALLVLIVANIFQGIKIMEPNMSWKWFYLAVISVLGAIVLVLELTAWTKFMYEHYPEKMKCCKGNLGKGKEKNNVSNHGGTAT